MKKAILLFAVLALMLAFVGCNKKKNVDVIEPVTFYYCNDLDSKADFANIFVSEIREGKDHINDLTGLLNLLLTGPISENLENPFPKKLSVISTEIVDNTVKIKFNDHLGSQSGLRLTLITTCVSMTVFDAVPCNTILITAESSMIDEMEELIITKDQLIFTDDYIPVPEE